MTVCHAQSKLHKHMVCQSLCVKDATEHLWGEALCAMPRNLMSEPIVVEWYIQGQGVMVSNPHLPM